MTPSAAAFIRSRARLSFGFSNPYLVENLCNKILSLLTLAFQGRTRFEQNSVDELVEAPSVNADHDPGAGEKHVRSFECAYVFVPGRYASVADFNGYQWLEQVYFEFAIG